MDHFAWGDGSQKFLRRVSRGHKTRLLLKPNRFVHEIECPELKESKYGGSEMRYMWLLLSVTLSSVLGVLSLWNKRKSE